MKEYEGYEITELQAIEQLMELDGGIDADMVDAYFHSTELNLSLLTGIKNDSIIFDGDRIYVKPSICMVFATKGGVF
tara:strand:- start:106 stop:336 length:231 start_codon:yes stop_codon:yes gene_type:complete